MTIILITLMKTLPFLILFGIDCAFFIALVVLTSMILCRIKMKLNMSTKLSFLSVIFALLMGMMLSVYWYYKKRNQDILINCYIYISESLIAAFQIVNLGRVITSWILESQPSTS